MVLQQNIVDLWFCNFIIIIKQGYNSDEVTENGVKFKSLDRGNAIRMIEFVQPGCEG